MNMFEKYKNRIDHKKDEKEQTGYVMDSEAVKTVLDMNVEGSIGR